MASKTGSVTDHQGAFQTHRPPYSVLSSSGQGPGIWFKGVPSGVYVLE